MTIRGRFAEWVRDLLEDWVDEEPDERWTPPPGGSGAPSVRGSKPTVVLWEEAGSIDESAGVLERIETSPFRCSFSVTLEER